LDLQFVVDSHSWKSKAGQVPEFKVSLKNSEGHTMVLVSSSRAVCVKFPKDEVFGLVSQMRRCAVSIPSNIAEGYGRRSTNDYLRLLQIAMGSVYEIQTLLEISRNLEYVSPSRFGEVYELSREIERMLSGLIKKVRAK